MKLEYQSTKWNKEVAKFQEFKKSVKGNFDNNENYVIDEFLKTGSEDFLRLYNNLAGVYERMSTYYYLDDIECKKIKEYVYLSGVAGILSWRLYKKDARTSYNKIVEDSINENIDYALFQLIAVDELDLQYLTGEENNIIILMYLQKYEQAKIALDLLPDNINVSVEWYYKKPQFLKGIYTAIIEHDEKKFNEELVARIKKYRKNMVGYSVIMDIVSVALIKMAEREGLRCTVDVIEIPRQFFEDTYLINKDIVKLPYFDEFNAKYMVNWRVRLWDYLKKFLRNKTSRKK